MTTPSDPVTAAVYCLLGLLPAARKSVEAFLSDQSCELPVRRCAERLLRKMDERRGCEPALLEDLEMIIQALRSVVDRSTHTYWVHDECCMSGGWYGTFRPASVGHLSDAYAALTRFRSAAVTLHKLTMAHRIADRLLG
jgi:hypothetical protein